ncbi:g13008 [Coccomyxa viridis]|uniref:G13008 protein n=1 Tax=Coccomyxa viridis TaxID=1274662 RepID=A0ABP1GGF3_9CHLO
MSPNIRRATVADHNTITTFNIQIALETEDVKLDPKIASQGVAALLEDSAKGRYYVLEEDGRIAAQLMITFEWSDWRNGQLWWIQSVYVHADYRRRGFFRALYQHVAQEAKQENAVGIRLYVDTHNTKAQETYKAMGMSSHYTVFEDVWV